MYIHVATCLGINLCTIYSYYKVKYPAMDFLQCGRSRVVLGYITLSPPPPCDVGEWDRLT